MLKAIIVEKTKDHAPYIHDLSKLAQLTSLEISAEQRKQLDTITTFNIRARYDKIKFNFHQIATKSYAKKWLNTCEEQLQWLQKNI